MKCKNIKAVLTLIRNINFSYVKARGYNITPKNICYIIRLSAITCTIYKHSLSKLHFTGITRSKDVKKIMKFVKKVLKNIPITFEVNNSMFTAKLNKIIEFRNIIEKVGQKNFFITNYSPENFPALFLKPGKYLKQQGFPTVLIFRNSSYIMIGASSLNIVKKCNFYIRNLLMTSVKIKTC